MKNELEIKKVFMKLIYTKPLETINVSSLCDELKIKRQTFYYHYRDIAELVESIFSDFSEELVSDNFDQGYLKTLCSFSNENIYLISSCINGGLSEVISRFYFKLLTPYVLAQLEKTQYVEHLNVSDTLEIAYYHAHGLATVMIESYRVEQIVQIDRVVNKINLFLDEKILERTAFLYYEKRKNI